MKYQETYKTYMSRYIDLGDPLYDELAAGIRKSYPHSCILWIEDVLNEELHKKYQLQKEDLIQRRGNGVVTERTLYHGTNADVVRMIVESGFDPSANRRSLYGRGSYFARDASYSKDYAPPNGDYEVSYLLVCSVLLGTEHTYGKDAVIDTSVHDHSVDRRGNPSIVVTPYRYGAIPRYIIAFYKSV